MAVTEKKHKAHVSEEKKQLVKEFEKLFLEYPIIGVLNMENMPAPQLAKMRRSLRSKAKIKMAKRRIMKVAMENVKGKVNGIEELEKQLVGMPALLFTKENPFSLAKTINASKSPAPIKAGQVAPRDIMVQAGPTPFAPGPIIGELSSVGIKSGIDAGKVAIKQDTVVAKKGAVVNDKLASILLRLGIMPMEIGLDLVAAMENGVIFGKDTLFIDEQQYLDNLTQAGRWAFNLAVAAAVLNDSTKDVLIGKAFNDAKALAVSQGILADGVKDNVIAGAVMQAKAVAAAANYEAQ